MEKMLVDSTVTVTGYNEQHLAEISRAINSLLIERGYDVAVRIENAQQPHSFNENVSHIEQKAIDRYTESTPVPTIALNGLFTVAELDGLSYKLRGGA